jgi:YaiO family outer membrane protein
MAAQAGHAADAPPALLQAAQTAPVTAPASASTASAGGALQSLAVEAGFTYDGVNGGSKDWSGEHISATRAFSERSDVYGLFQNRERFGLQDQDLTLGADYSPTQTWSTQMELTGSPTHRISPRYQILAQAGRTIGNGFALKAGEEHAEYNAGATDIQFGTLEYYWSHFRAAAVLNLGEARHLNMATSGTVQLTDYYGDRNAIGLSFTLGEEHENVGDLGPSPAVARSHVTDLSLVGHHWFSRDWALTYDFGYHQFGSFYSRRRIGLGIRKLL